MRVPGSFALAYLRERKTAEELQRVAGSRLNNLLCRPNQWLFDDRVKDEESALAKLELGPVPALESMQDLYAATIVVPTTAEVDDAVGAIEADLPGARVVRRPKGSAEAFAYDDVHVIASLGHQAPGLPRAFQEREFEIQIRTGLQYAWWRATHDVTYKGGARSWRVSRVASQVRASLELLDSVLGDLRGAAGLQAKTADEVDAAFERVAGWLEGWPEGRRPREATRFVDAVQALSQASGLGLDRLEALLEDGEGRRLAAEEEVTPFQAILGITLSECGPTALCDLPRRHRFVLVTEELERACPEATRIDPARVVKL